MNQVNELIEKYQLKEHPEGGYYRETYRSPAKINSLPDNFSGPRNYATAIYFLLPEGKFSRLHRIKSDELWHFYLGGPLTIFGIDLEGNPYELNLGNDLEGSTSFQHVVPAGHWFGAKPKIGSIFSFVGCTVSPGFDFADFELAEVESLRQQFSKASTLIDELS